jgi:erythromycin esterase-like protein
MKKKHFYTILVGVFCLLSFLLICWLMAAVHENEKDCYNLDFAWNDSIDEVDFAWSKVFVDVAIDTSIIADGNHPLCLKIPDLLKQKQSNEAVFYLYQTVALPNITDEKLVTVSINSRCFGLKDAILRIACIDATENTLRVDTISINSCDGAWTSRQLSFVDKYVRRINITVKGFTDNMLEGKMWLSKMGIAINGKNIYDYGSSPFFASQNSVVADKSAAISYPFAGDTLPKEIRGRKIVALGETVHGCRSLNNAAFDLIKQAIRKNECQIVLLEIPIDMGLFWNAFVTGRAPDSAINMIKLTLNSSLLSTHVAADFLVWLRSYNQYLDHKVHLFGVDDIYSDMLANPLFDYAYAHYNIGNRGRILSLVNAVRDFDCDSILLHFRPDDKLKSLIDGKEYTLLQHVLNRYREVRKEETIMAALQRVLYRDSTMWINTKTVLDIYGGTGECAMLYAHFVHTNKRHVFMDGVEWPSLGNFLNRHYKEGYFSIAMLIGEGYCANGGIRSKKAFDSQSISLKLQAPPQNSIEEWCLAIGREKFYMSALAFSGGEFMVRNILSMSKGKEQHQFISVFLPQRADAVLFIRDNNKLDADNDRDDMAKDNKFERIQAHYAMRVKLRYPNF